MRPLRIPTRTFALLAMLAVAAGLALAPLGARAQGVDTRLQPAYGFVAPGAGIDIDLVVPVAGHTFNGFHATIGYDPAALTFVQAVPVTDQQGCLLTGGCSSACGNTFHVFHAAGDSLSVDVSLLCDQVLLTGPGQLYRLHFLASNTDQITYVTTRSARFLDSGVNVAPGSTSNSRVVIGTPLGVDGGPGTELGLRLSAQPNPARGAVALSLSAPRDGIQQVDVLDLSGRMVRHLSGSWQPRGSRRLAWDGADARGSAVPSGVYLVRLRVGEQLAFARLTVIR